MADFKFTLGFKIYYVFHLSSLHTWNSLPLITFYQHSSTWWIDQQDCSFTANATWERLAFIASLINSFYFQLSSESLHVHPTLTFQLPLALTYVFIFLISLFKVYVKALYWAPRGLSPISRFPEFSIYDFEREGFVLPPLWPEFGKDECDIIDSYLGWQWNWAVLGLCTQPSARS